MRVTREDPAARQGESLSMWFGAGDEDLSEQEAAQLSKAKATIERIRKIQQLRSEIKRTKEAHDRAVAELSGLSA